VAVKSQKEKAPQKLAAMETQGGGGAIRGELVLEAIKSR